MFRMGNACKHMIKRGRDQVSGVLLQNSWYSEGSTKVWGTIWKFLKPWVCCIRWMFLYRRSLRVNSYDLKLSRASSLKCSSTPLHSSDTDRTKIYTYITAIDRPLPDSMIHFIRFRVASVQTKCALQWKPTNTSPELTGLEWLSGDIYDTENSGNTLIHFNSNVCHTWESGWPSGSLEGCVVCKAWGEILSTWG